jgi:hypothetical protein
MASTTFSGPVTSLNGFIGDITGDITASELVVSGSSTTPLVRITQTGTGNALLVEDSTNPDSSPFVVDASGNVIRGFTSAIATANYAGSAATPGLQNVSTETPGASFGTFLYNVSSSQSPQFTFSRSGSGTIGTFGAVAVNNFLGAIGFNGDDGAKFVPAASITAAVDGTPGTDDMPGRLLFSTTADGAAAPTERMRITNAGNVGIGVSAPVNRLQISGSFGRGAPVTETGNFTLADDENWIICNGAGSITATFPAASLWTGREVMIKTIAAQTVVSASSNIVPITGGAAGTAILAATAGAWATLVSDGTNWVIMQA